MMILIFWLTLAILFYIYIGYVIILKALLLLVNKKNNHKYDYDSLPLVTIIVAAHNEGNVIKSRIENLLNLDYPNNKLEIIIASDGSNDETFEIANNFEYSYVIALNFKLKIGRAMIHNESIKVSNADIVIYTDADTEFERDFLQRISDVFADKTVGCAVGNLIYKTKQTAISKSEGLYWKYEKLIRKLESDAGILATGSGACIAVRRELWKNLSPTDDVDFATPLDIIRQNYKVVYIPDAIAYDSPPHSMIGELSVKIRQTSKNFIGTLRHWPFIELWRFPLISCGLLSHKILRWVTPFFLIAVFFSNLLLLNSGQLYQLTFMLQLVFYFIGIIGLIAELFKKKVSIASTIFSFCVANIGMGIGIISGILGNAPSSYKSED